MRMSYRPLTEKICLKMMSNIELEISRIFKCRYKWNLEVKVLKTYIKELLVHLIEIQMIICIKSILLKNNLNSYIKIMPT